MQNCLVSQGWTQLFEMHAVAVVAVGGQMYPVVMAVAVVVAVLG